MTSPRFGTAVHRLFQRLGVRPTQDATDAGLIAQFAADRSEDAFAAIVRRHGPMVLGVCQRILRNSADADDALQATFLVLARKATTLDGRRPLASWLYTVARNLALKHRSTTVRRRVHEERASAMRNTQRNDGTRSADVRELLDVELGQLPEKYKAPLILCHLQGMTHGEAAHVLGWPAGSMAKRMARGQELLRERLAARGASLSAAALAACLTENASAAVSPTVVAHMSRAAVLYATGQATTGLVSTQVTALAAGAMPAVVLTRWKVAIILLLGIGALSAGAIVFHEGAAKPEAIIAPVPVVQATPAPSAEDPRDQELRRKLARNVALDHGIDPNTPFHDVLEFLADRGDLKIQIDDDAFAAAGVDAVQKRPVSLPRVTLPMETILRLLLRQIEPLDGRVAGYRFEKGALVITPVLLEIRANERFPRGFAARLFAPVRCEKEPYGMSLAEALNHYGKLFGQKLVLDHKAFADLGEPDAARIPLAGRGRELPEAPCLVDVLDVIVWQVDGDAWKSYFHVRDGLIEITAARSESEQAKLLAAHQEGVREYLALWKGTPRLDEGLRGRVTLERGIEAKTTLGDALDYLAYKQGLNILIDEISFEATGLEKVRDQFVELGRQYDVPLDTVLRKILEQVANDQCTACVVQREGYIEVVPEHNDLRKAKPLSARQLDMFWEDLAGQSMPHVRRATQTLIQAWRESVPYLKEHVKPVPPRDPTSVARIRKLLADLDSNQFAARQTATEELENLGDEAIPYLRERLAEKPPLEVQKRVVQILGKMTDSPRPEWVRTIRTVRVLEAINTPDARQVLGKIAAGEPTAPPTQAAREALERLAR
ncbi:MAG: RNA polymerase sigma factor [Gemmataceae bacterium]|nr:RNA polymerase sigma factor [Gemmataceae bacterium]